MKISWSLDDEYEIGIDPDELLGDITLFHQGTRIQERVTVLDSWFNSLIDGYRAMVRGVVHFESDLITEPDSLCFERTDQGIVISYKNVSLPVCALDDLFEALWQASTVLIQTIKDNAPEKDRTMVRKIEEFVENRP